MTTMPLSVLTTVDPVHRETVIFGLLMGSPRVVVLRHDIDSSRGLLRRTVLDATGVVEDVNVHLEHACLSCAVREDAIPALRQIALDGRWDSVVLALPVTADSLAPTTALVEATSPGGELDLMHVATVATVAELGEVEEDLLGVDSVAERGLALSEDDERSMGEVLAAHLAHADLVVASGSGRVHPGPLERTGHDLIEHLRAHDSQRLDGLHLLSAENLASRRHDSESAQRRCNPLHVHAPTIESTHAWSLELSSTRPLHPERLLDRIEELGTGRVRSRGVFWVPNRPDSACLWDGAGGQLYIGELCAWEAKRPYTRLIFTGATLGECERLRMVFNDVLATKDEIDDGGVSWLDRADALAPWLGVRRASN